MNDWTRDDMEGEAIPTNRAILIAGPTASGKSAVAMAVADRIGGVVVNADSMQVYRDLRILTARPSDSDMARVPHRLFGHVDAADAYSVGRWLADLRIVLQDLRRQSCVPVLVGGTGLYLRAAVTGLSSIPDVPAEIRARLRAEAALMTPADLHRRLAARDPVMASRLQPTDPQRTLRALEIFEATGTSLLSFQQGREAPQFNRADIIGVVVVPSRTILAASIDRRLDGMIAAGAIEETARLAARRLDPSLPAMRALGVPHLMRGLRDPDSLETNVAAAKVATRQYAKRQLTFARNQLKDFPWVSPDDAVEQIISRWSAASDQ